MYALQCPQCHPRNKLPQMWLPEFTAQEQGKKSVIEYFRFSFVIFFNRQFSRLLKDICMKKSSLR
jgi:hypothetical protein